MQYISKRENYDFYSLLTAFVGSSGIPCWYRKFMLSAILSPLATVFHVQADQITWLVSAYALAYTLAAPIIGFYQIELIDEKLCLWLFCYYHSIV
ncbi:hypothetical protein J4731_23130 [Providencia rettgeri]|nr:hypothetical protein [Providencia rettgeri]